MLQTVKPSKFNWKSTLSVLFPILITSYSAIAKSMQFLMSHFFSKLHNFQIPGEYEWKAWNLVFWYPLSMWVVWSTSFYPGIPFKLSNNFSRDLLFFSYGALGYITNFRMYTQKAHLRQNKLFLDNFVNAFSVNT